MILSRTRAILASRGNSNDSQVN